MNFGVMCKTKRIKDGHGMAIDKKSGCRLAWHNGKRQDKHFLVLWELLKPFNIERYCTDDRDSDSKHIPSHQYQIGKNATWKIERKNI